MSADVNDVIAGIESTKNCRANKRKIKLRVFENTVLRRICGTR